MNHFHRNILRLPNGLLLITAFLFLAVSPSSSTLAAEPPAARTRILPLQIVGQNISERDRIQIDNAVAKTFAEKGIKTLSRKQSEQLADYTGIWPPETEVLSKIAKATGADYVGTGTLTLLGNSISLDMKLFDLLAPKTPTYYFETSETLMGLESVLGMIAADISGYLGQTSLIASIAPEGNKRIDSGAILRKIATKPGDPYDQSALRADLKAIFSMGYFNDVQIDVSDTSRGKAVVFRVVEKPIIKSVLFSGIEELKEEDVREAANIKERFILNPLKITQAEEAIRQLYKSKGFYNSEVSSSVTYPDDQGAEVRFQIDEGKKIYIKEISFEGNAAFDDDDLLDEMETSEKWFLSWLTDGGLLDRNRIQQDARRIVAFYNNHGFLDAKIGAPQITQKEEYLYVKFVIDEGTRYKVGSVDIEGDLITDKTELLDLLNIRRQEFMSRQVVRDDILALTDRYAESGYAFASVKPVTVKSPSGDRMDVTFKIRKGNLVYVDRVIIKGNTRTRDNVIRRELRIVEGGVFNSKALRESTQALQRLVYFEEVNITPEPSLDPNRMTITVEVKEKSTGSFSIGAGYSSVDKLILMGQISENNFLGRGDTLSLSANISGTSARYNLGYTNPHLNDSALSWGLDLYKTEREYDDYDRASTGGGLRIGYPIFGKWRLYGNYSYTDTDLTNVSEDASYIIRNSVDIHITSALKFSLVRDTRNRRYGASKGSRNVLSVKYAGGPLGGDAEFTKLEGSTSWYFPLPLKSVFHIKGAAGQVFENETDKLPVYERFYLGGVNSIRGFKYAKVSPIDPDSDERIGGDKMWYTNTEVVFPLLETQGLMGVLFYDAGQVLNDDQDWSAVNDNIKQGAGVEVRWLSPMGPLRLVWGFNLDPQEDEDESVWDFSVGGTF